MRIKDYISDSNRNRQSIYR